MPEVQGEASVCLYLNKTDISKLIDLIANRIESTNLTCGHAVKCKDGTVEIESEQTVTLEFELSDYAQERDEP